MTVGELRKIIKDLSDDTPVRIANRMTDQGFSIESVTISHFEDDGWTAGVELDYYYEEDKE